MQFKTWKWHKKGSKNNLFYKRTQKIMLKCSFPGFILPYWSILKDVMKSKRPLTRMYCMWLMCLDCYQQSCSLFCSFRVLICLQLRFFGSKRLKTLVYRKYLFWSVHVKFTLAVAPSPNSRPSLQRIIWHINLPIRNKRGFCIIPVFGNAHASAWSNIKTHLFTCYAGTNTLSVR